MLLVGVLAVYISILIKGIVQRAGKEAVGDWNQSNHIDLTYIQSLTLLCYFKGPRLFKLQKASFSV